MADDGEEPEPKKEINLYLCCTRRCEFGAVDQGAPPPEDSEGTLRDYKESTGVVYLRPRRRWCQRGMAIFSEG
jgi:hypothetical protein